MPHSDAINKTLESVTSERARRLTMLGSYVDGTQYDGQPSWFNDSVPVARRAPCVVEQVAEGAVESYLDLVLGEAQFPVFDADNPDTNATLLGLCNTAGFRGAAREALDSALSMGTACSVQSVENGKLFVRSLGPAWCEPELDPYGVVVRLVEQIPSVQPFKDATTGKVEQRVVVHERVIDKDTDTRSVYYVPPNKEPWKLIEKPVVVRHGLGWCPVVWYRHRVKSRNGQRLDGRAIHASLLDEIDALNRALSQEHRAAHYCGDPQPVITGIEDNENPAPAPSVWRGASYPDESPAVRREHAQWVAGAYGAGQDNDAIMRGPGIVWRLRNPQARAELLTLPAGALEGVSKNADRLRETIASTMAWVRINESTQLLSGAGLSAMSGAAMAWLYRKQLSRCDTIRDEFGTRWMLPVMQQLWLLAAAVPVDVERRPSGAPPRTKLKWPPYFAPNEQDRATIMERVRNDFQTGLLTRRKAVETMAPIYGIEDVEAYLSELGAEAIDRERDQAETYHAAVEAMAGAAKATRPAEGLEEDEEEDEG